MTYATISHLYFCANYIFFLLYVPHVEVILLESNRTLTLDNHLNRESNLIHVVKV